MVTLFCPIEMKYNRWSLMGGGGGGVEFEMVPFEIGTSFFYECYL